MQYKQKNFLFTAMVAVMGFALVTSTGCDPDGDNPENKGKETYYQWHSIDPTVAKFGNDKLLSMVHSDNLYFGTDGEGLVIWDGKDEKPANFTQLKAAAGLTGKKGDGTGAANKDVAGTNKINKLIAVGTKKVAFASSAAGVGIVDDKAVSVAWLQSATGVPAGAVVNDFIVVENAAKAKFLYAAFAADAGGTIAWQPLAATVDAWNVTIKDTSGNGSFGTSADLTKQARAFGLDKDGNLLISMANSGDEAGFKTLLKAGFGVADRQLDVALAAHTANKGSDAGHAWKVAKHAQAVVTFGDKLVLATDDALILLGDTANGGAANQAKKIEDAQVYAIVKDGANGAHVFTKNKGILYVKADGTLDASKAFGKASLKDGVDVKADGSKFDFTDNIIAMAKVGNKTVYGTGDKGIVVREEKTRDKK